MLFFMEWRSIVIAVVLLIQIVDSVLEIRERKEEPLNYWALGRTFWQFGWLGILKWILNLFLTAHNFGELDYLGIIDDIPPIPFIINIKSKTILNYSIFVSLFDFSVFPLVYEEYCGLMELESALRVDSRSKLCQFAVQDAGDCIQISS